MTYNTHGCVGTDGRYDPGRIVDVVQQMSPDLLGLQEVRLPQDSGPHLLSRLQTTLPDYSIVFGETLADERGAYGNALLSRYPVGEFTDLSLEIDPSYDTRKPLVEDRRAIIARLSVPDGNPFTIIVTHLGLERWARKQQAERLITAIDQAVDVTTEHAAFLGDFNEWFFADRFLRRVDRHFSKHAARRTFPSRFPILPLDRIWITRRLRRVATWAPRDWPARVASDHLPLCVDVEPEW